MRPIKPPIARSGPAPEPIYEEDLTRWERFKEWVHGELSWFNRFFNTWIVRLTIIGAHAAVVVGACFVGIWWFALDQVYYKIDDVPERDVGLVLGTAKQYHGQDNVFFTERISAAASLYKAGKVKYLLVSGEYHPGEVDEPTDMKAALVAKGVPSERIYCDDAGFRTLDSVIRAHTIFGQTDFIVISQRFQNERALYVARRRGTPDAIAFNAGNAPAWSTFSKYLWEIPTRFAAVIQVEFLGVQPAVGGPKISISPSTPPVDAVKIAPPASSGK